MSATGGESVREPVGVPTEEAAREAVSGPTAEAAREPAGVPTADAASVPTADAASVPTADAAGVPTADAAGAPAGEPVRVLVADDHAAVRAGLVMILGAAEGIEVVGEAADGATAVRMATALRPDVVLMDVRMPGTDGIEATRVLSAGGIAEVLILTTFDLDEYVHETLRAGAAGFLLKSVDAPSLVESVRLVAAGDAVLAPGVTRRLLREFAQLRGAGAAGATGPADRAGGPDRSALQLLTEREREVFDCLGEGLSNHQIAVRLDIGDATVKTHVSRVLQKLSIRSRVQAAILAGEWSRPGTAQR